jgi:hypothetical protein
MIGIDDLVDDRTSGLARLGEHRHGHCFDS